VAQVGTGFVILAAAAEWTNFSNIVILIAEFVAIIVCESCQCDLQSAGIVRKLLI